MEPCLVPLTGEHTDLAPRKRARLFARGEAGTPTDPRGPRRVDGRQFVQSVAQTPGVERGDGERTEAAGSASGVARQVGARGGGGLCGPAIDNREHVSVEVFHGPAGRDGARLWSWARNCRFVRSFLRHRYWPTASNASSVRMKIRPAETAGDETTRSPRSFRCRTCGSRPARSTTVSPVSLKR